MACVSFFPFFARHPAVLARFPAIARLTLGPVRFVAIAPATAHATSVPNFLPIVRAFRIHANMLHVCLLCHLYHLPFVLCHANLVAVPTQHAITRTNTAHATYGCVVRYAYAMASISMSARPSPIRETHA